MIHIGDCIEVMATLEPDSVDAVVTDPPYGLEFMGKGWDKFGGVVEAATDSPGWRAGHGGLCVASKNNGVPFGGGGQRVRYHAGPAFQAWCEAWGREALRVTKPGGYLLAFGGTRTHHRLVCGLEDAGWIIRDELDWIYASGFPKGKANLKPAHEPIVLARKPGPLRPLAIDACRIPGTVPSVPQWEAAGSNNNWQADGRNGAMSEPNAAGRWPSNLLLSDPALFDEPNAEVVGSGAAAPSAQPYERNVDGRSMFWNRPMGPEPVNGYGDTGGYSRFFRIPERGNDALRTQADQATPPESPANSEGSTPADRGDYPVALIVPKADRGDREPVLRGQLTDAPTTALVTNSGNVLQRCQKCRRTHPNGHVGPCARCGGELVTELAAMDGTGRSKHPTRSNLHPTVKPTDLMRHLVRLVTPQGGTVLDCFLGSGSTAIAAELEGFAWIGIEKEPEYVAIANARLNGTQKGLGLAI